MLETFRVKPLMQLNALLFQESGHGGIHIGIGSRDLVAPGLQCTGTGGHGRSADADEVDMVAFLNHPLSMDTSNPQAKQDFMPMGQGRRIRVVNRCPAVNPAMMPR